MDDRATRDDSRGAPDKLGVESKTRRPRWPIVLGALLVCGGSAAVFAQQTTYRGRVLHEYFDLSRVAETGAAGGGISRSEASRRTTSAPGERPSLTLEVGADELIHGEDGPLAEEKLESPYGGLDPATSSNQLDDQTDKVDELSYYSNFDPSVVPYKRVVAQNRVRFEDDGTYHLETLRTEAIPIRSADQAPSTHDVFWGSFMLHTSAGGLTPLPSVAPEYLILERESEPNVDLEVLRDAAGNSYVRTSHEGLVRLNLRIAAPRFYFDGELDDQVRWSDFDALTMTALPERAQQTSRRVLDAIGVSRDQTPRTAVTALIEYFRNFEGKPLPADKRGDDLYASIALEQIGVCRHRSFAFVITAQSLGIPTHYVYNEAHAFVEILWPGSGWRRIDLGGAAEDVMMQSGGEQTSVHDGAERDPFPQPPAYRRELERMAERSSGDEPSRPSPDGGDGEGRTGDNRGDAELSEMSTEMRDELDDPDPRSRANRAPVPDLVESRGEGDARTETRLRLVEAGRQARRGQKLRVVGDLAAMSGRGLPDQSVEILLGPAGSISADRLREVGSTRTDAQGRFETTVQIPRDLSIGRWTLYLVYRGSSRHRPAQAPGRAR